MTISTKYTCNTTCTQGQSMMGINTNHSIRAQPSVFLFSAHQVQCLDPHQTAQATPLPFECGHSPFVAELRRIYGKIIKATRIRKGI